VRLKYVAVFETAADADSVTTEAELRYLTNELRKIALEQLQPPHYAVMTRDNIMALLPPDKDAAECFEGACLVEVGRNVGADYAVQGTVSLFDTLRTLSVEAYETMGGKLIGSFTAESETVRGLLDAMRLKAPEMLLSILKLDGLDKKPMKQRGFRAQPKDTVPPVVDSAAVAIADSIQPLPAIPDSVLKAPPAIDTTVIDTITIVPQVAAEPTGIRPMTWVAIALDVLGAAALGVGVWQNSVAGEEQKNYMALPIGTPQAQLDAAFKKADDATTLRNIGYAVGGVLLATGITFHIVF
jgi:hypothetical protein